jgi:putative transposase
LIETPKGNMAKGMRQLNGVYTQSFNRRHQQVGHLFQGRYKAIHIEKESHLLEVCRYVVLNPVRARLRKWSSYLGTAGRVLAHRSLTTDWVLGQFGGTRTKTQKAYRRYVQEGVGKENIWDEVKGQVLLGREEFVEKLGSRLRKQKAIADIPKSQRYANRPRLEKIFSEKVLQSKEVRNRKIGEAVEKYGYTQREIADHLGLHFTSVSRIMRERTTK